MIDFLAFQRKSIISDGAANNSAWQAADAFFAPQRAFVPAAPGLPAVAAIAAHARGPRCGQRSPVFSRSMRCISVKKRS